MVNSLKKYDIIYTIEEHFPDTGIKGIISSKLSDQKTIVKSINNKSEFISHLGSRKYVRKKFGISSNRAYKIIVDDAIKNRNRLR